MKKTSYNLKPEPPKTKPALTTDEEDMVKYWMAQVDYALKYRAKFSDVAMWPTYRNWYRGEFGEESLKLKMHVNKTFAYIRSMVPRTYFRNPSVSVTATHPEFVASARILQLVDRNLIRKTNVKAHLKKAILDAGLCGIGPIKLGFDSEFGYLPEQAVDEDQGTATQIGMETGERIEYNADIISGMPWLARVRPDEVLIPYGCDNPRELPWIGHIIMRPVKDIQEDQKYNKKFAQAVKGGFSVANDSSPKAYSYMQTGNKEDYALIYEIRCFRSGKMYSICEDMPLLVCDDTLQTDGLPWEFIIFNEDPEYFWGIPDVKMIEPQQKEINEIRSYASKMRKLNLLRIMYQKNSITGENLEKLLSMDIDDVGAGIEIDADSIPASIQIVSPANVSDNLIREQQQNDADFRDTLGYGANQMGDFSPFHNKTATEASIVKEGADIRSDERRDIVADVLTNIVSKFNQFIFMYWKTEKVIELAGADGMTYWVSFTGDQLKGEFTYVINPEDSKPVDSATRQDAATAIFERLNGDQFTDQLGLRELYLDQSTSIDPAYKGLIRSPQPQMPVGPNGEQLNATPEQMAQLQAQMQPPSPPPQQIKLSDLQQDPVLRKKVLGV